MRDRGGEAGGGFWNGRGGEIGPGCIIVGLFAFLDRNTEVSVLNLSEGLLVIRCGGLCADVDACGRGCSDTTMEAGGSFVSLLEEDGGVAVKGDFGGR